MKKGDLLIMDDCRPRSIWSDTNTGNSNAFIGHLPTNNFVIYISKLNGHYKVISQFGIGYVGTSYLNKAGK
jgi:hypothetical protein